MIQITKNDKTTVEDRFFISSLGDGNAEIFAQAVRGHWVVESFHWHLDVTFREDNCQVIDKRAALNLNILRIFAIAILKNVEMDKRDSMKTKRFKVMINPSFWEGHAFLTHDKINCCIKSVEHIRKTIRDKAIKIYEQYS